MRLSVVIPFYNEQDQVRSTVSAVCAVLNGLSHDYELILVDDGSADETWKTILEVSGIIRRDDASEHKGTIRGIGFSRNFGKEAAICAGLHTADCDAAIVMDGDLQHPPEHIPYMVSVWESGEADVVEGVKSSRSNDSMIQRMNAFLFYKLFGKAAGYDLQNASDYKLLDRKVLDEWRRLGEHDTFFRGLSAWLGFRRKTFNFIVPPRNKGKSKWSSEKLFRLSITAMTSFSSLPLQLITLLGLVFLAFSAVLAVQTLIRWFTGTAADGFTTVILLILFTGGAVMISLGLIGIYVSRIFAEVKGRPRYIVSKQTENVSE